MANPLEQVESILLAATELATPEQRAEFIAQECGGDEDLQHEVERLLDAYLQSGDFLEGATVELKSGGGESLLEQPGAVIGSYKLLQQIGEGGMGVVFMAEQDRPVRRTVALKIIKPGMDSRKVVGRFEAERQALALMDHANIAKVFDAGATDAGRPYFVMELVKGVPITEYCDEHQLSIEQRLKLFGDVCHAVQHAHQKGIIHRDLKPSNVLVAEYDDQPIPKVIDFGVAKAISQRLTERTLFTEYGQIIGTFEYMSPEQAKLNQLDVDTRTDVYSLGVLLYELLAGSTPLEKDRLRSAAFDEVLRIIGEEEPPTPSTRLRSSQTLPAISAKRQTEPDKLTKSVRGDLDWIVMKCLEKDRGRRYETASAITADIARFLANEPISARPPTRGYRIKKFVQRNKMGVLAAAAIMLAVAVGFTISVIGFVHARTEARRSRETMQFLKDMLAAAGPQVAQGRDAMLLREILDLTAERIEKELEGNPEIEGDLTVILGDTYSSIGQDTRAISLYERAVACYRLEPGGDSTKLAMALGNLGSCQSFLVDVSTGRNNAALGLEMARRCGDRETLASCLSSMAYACNAWGVTSREGVVYLREALALRRELATNPLATAACMRRLGHTLGNDEGDELLQEALELYRTERGDKYPGTINCVWAIGQRQLQRGELDEAEQSLQHAFDEFSRLYTPAYPLLGVAWRHLATAFVAQGKWEAAEKLAEPTDGKSWNANHRDMLGKISAYRGDWPATVDQLIQARALGNYLEVNRLAAALFAAGRRQEYVELCQELISDKHSSVTVEMDSAAAYLLLPVDETTLPVAKEFADAALSASDGALVNSKKRINKALALYRLGKFDEALEVANTPDFEQGVSANHAECWAIRALSYAELGRLADAQEAIDSAKRLFAREDRRWRGDPLENVFNWQIAELLVQEAEQFLESQAQ